LNSILTFIVGLVVTVLLAALIGPSLIDWNQYRAVIEMQASKATGRVVRIEGDIGFHVLPSPNLRLSKVTLAEPDAAPGDLFARFDAIDADVALAPLFGGEVSITSLTFVRPEIHLVVDAKGKTNWGDIVPTDAASRDGAFSLAAISLDAARFQDGLLSYDNQQTGHSWQAHDISGTVMATSLLGPMRADLDARVNGVPLGLRIGLAYFGKQKPFPVTIETDWKGTDAKFFFTGLATGFSPDARLDGKGSIEIGKSRGEADKDSLPPVRVEAGVVATAKGANLRDLAVVMAGTTLSGVAHADWQGRPHFDVTLASDALTLDPLTDRFDSFVIGQGDALKALAALPVPKLFDARLNVTVEGVLAHDALIRKASLSLTLEKGAVRIDNLSGEIGGETRIALEGKLQPRPAGNEFDGAVSLTSHRLAELALWLDALRRPGAREPGTMGVNAAVARSLSLTSRVTIRSDMISFDAMNIAYALTPDQPGLKGKVSYQIRDGSNPILRLDMQTASFDADPLLALWPMDKTGAFKLMQHHDVGVTLAADRFAALNTPMRGLRADAVLEAGHLYVADFAAEELSGAKLAFKGDLTGVATGDLSNVMGRFEAHIEAARFGVFLQMAGIEVPEIVAPVSLDMSGQTVEADDATSQVDTLILKGLVGDSRVDGVIKRRHATRNEEARMDIIANAANNNGAVLLRQFGFAPRIEAPGPGNASLRMSGMSDKLFDAEFRLNVGEADMKLAGSLLKPLGDYSFDGHLDLNAPGIAPVVSLYGASSSLADFAAVQADGAGLVLASDMVSDASHMRFSHIEAVAGRWRLTGQADFLRGTDAAKPKLSGKLEMNRLDLATLVGLQPDQSFTWGGDALVWSDLGALDADMDLVAGRLALGPLHFEQASLSLDLAEGILKAESASAQFAGGPATISARFTGGDGEPALDLLLATDKADLAKAGEQVAGASFAKGRFNAQIQMAGHGRSWLALVSSLQGQASFASLDAAFAPLNVAGFGKSLDEIKTIDAFPKLVSDVLQTGASDVSDMSADVAIADGMLHFTQDNLVLSGGKGKVEASFDLPRLALAGRLDVVPDLPAHAPGFAIVARGRAGDLTTRIDTSVLENFVATRLIARRAEDLGVGALPKELRDLMGSAANDDKGQALKLGGIALPLARP